MKPQGTCWDRSWSARSRVDLVSKAEADWMVRRHYLGKWPGVVVLRVGLWVDDRLLGLVVYALPPVQTHARYGTTCWELARLWVDDELPQNVETFLIAASVRLVRREERAPGCLVSYADPSAGHSGVIYRAANWLADGRTNDDRKTPRCDYAHPLTGRVYSRRSHVPAGVVPRRVPRVSKPRFYLRLRAQ